MSTDQSPSPDMQVGNARQQCHKPGCGRLPCFHLRFSDPAADSDLAADGGPAALATDTCGAHLAYAVDALVSWAGRRELPACGVRVTVYATDSPGRYLGQDCPPSPLVDDAIDVVSIQVRRDTTREPGRILVDYSAADGMCRSIGSTRAITTTPG